MTVPKTKTSIIAGNPDFARAARTTFLAVAVLALGALGCGPAESTCMTDGPEAQIADNHPNGDHELDIPAADVAAGAEESYDIQGDNTGHGHTVTVSAAQFETLQEGDSVTVESSDLGAAGNDHTHVVTLSCPEAE